MNQLGNLAIICARRSNVLMKILDGEATVCVGTGPGRQQLSAGWNDNTAGLHFILIQIYERCVH
jgi:hypothetical protein